MLATLKRIITLSVVLFICTTSCATQLATNKALDNKSIISGSVGDVKVGMTIDELYSVVGKDNTELVDAYAEGMFSPIVAIYKTAKQKSIVMHVAVASNNRGFIVDSIEVFDDSYITSKGIGVNSKLGDIKASYKISRIIETDGGVIVILDKSLLRVSFKLEQLEFTDSNGYPDTLKVKSLLIY